MVKHADSNALGRGLPWTYYNKQGPCHAVVDLQLCQQMKAEHL